MAKQKKVASWDRIYFLWRYWKDCWNDKKGIKYYINLIDKASSRLERIDSNFERSSFVDKIFSNSIACSKEVIHERKSQLTQQVSLLSYCMKSSRSHQPVATTIPSSQQPSTSKHTLHQQKKKKKKKKRKNPLVCLTDKWNGEAEVCKTHLYREVFRIYLSYCLK